MSSFWSSNSVQWQTKALHLHWTKANSKFGSKRRAWFRLCWYSTIQSWRTRTHHGQNPRLSFENLQVPVQDLWNLAAVISGWKKMKCSPSYQQQSTFGAIEPSGPWNQATKPIMPLFIQLSSGPFEAKPPVWWRKWQQTGISDARYRKRNLSGVAHVPRYKLACSSAPRCEHSRGSPCWCKVSTRHVWHMQCLSKLGKSDRSWMIHMKSRRTTNRDSGNERSLYIKPELLSIFHKIQFYRVEPNWPMYRHNAQRWSGWQKH